MPELKTEKTGRDFMSLGSLEVVALNMSDLVAKDRVHRSVYTDPAIFDLEMERIFAGGWVYVGHESQVPNSGDYLTTQIGRQPVVMSRHTDGQVYVIYNSCGHRGAIVCNAPSGHADLFQCCYHGWTFKTNGDLDAVALPSGYGEQFDTSDPALGMQRVARVDTYKGFVFACLTPDVPDLDVHLGDAKASIDELVARAPDGRIGLTAGVHKYVYRGNWKLQFENTVDMYHVPFSHASTLRRDGRQFSRRKGTESGSAIATSGRAAARWEERGAWGAPTSGHSYTEHQPTAERAPNEEPAYQEYVARLTARHGAERTAEILRPKRHNTAFFPNMCLQALNQHVRVIRPIAADKTEVWVYPVQLKGAPEEINTDNVRQLNLTHSAASLIQTDDLEAFHRCQAGLDAENSQWVWFARGVERDRPDDAGNLTNNGTVELPQRAFYAAWKRLMTAGE